MLKNDRETIENAKNQKISFFTVKKAMKITLTLQKEAKKIFKKEVYITLI